MRKPRHNPDKPQNNIEDCPYDDGITCEKGYPWYCEGNPHNCKSLRYRYLASLPEHKRKTFIEKNQITGSYTNLINQ